MLASLHGWGKMGNTLILAMTFLWSLRELSPNWDSRSLSGLVYLCLFSIVISASFEENSLSLMSPHILELVQGSFDKIAYDSWKIHECLLKMTWELNYSNLKSNFEAQPF